MSETGPAYSKKSELDENELKQWCNYNKIPYHVTDLSNLDTFEHDAGYVYTGDTANEVNNGNPHHWLAVVGNSVFDSYGQHDYKLKEGFDFMKHSPKLLQHWDSNVCGEYCSLLLSLAHEKPNLDSEEIGQAFVEQYGFGNNRSNNDLIALKGFKERAPTQIRETLPSVNAQEAKPKEDSKEPSNTNSDSDSDAKEPSEV